MSTDPTEGEKGSFTLKAVLLVAATAVFGWSVSFVVMPLIQNRGDGFDPLEAICSAIGIYRPKGQAQIPAPVPPPSNVSWTVAGLADVARGDPKAGEAIANDTCVACHYVNSLSSDPQTIPSTTGLPARAMYKQLIDIKAGARPNEQMLPVLEELTPQQLADVAAFYSTLPVRHRDFRAIDGEAATKLVILGDAKRALPPCASCHEPSRGGPLEAPTLTGQYPAYIAAQLRAYASGERKNDLYGRMRSIAAKLTDKEIEDLALYYDGWR